MRGVSNESCHRQQQQRQCTQKVAWWYGTLATKIWEHRSRQDSIFRQDCHFSFWSNKFVSTDNETRQDDRYMHGLLFHPCPSASHYPNDAYESKLKEMPLDQREGLFVFRFEFHKAVMRLMTFRKQPTNDFRRKSALPARNSLLRR